jgi:glycosyltransferase involved in cell wall biosynthesis
MKIAIDITPLNDTRLLSHRVRGTGFYLKNLKKALLEYFPENTYTFFNRGEHIDRSIDLVHYPYFEPFFVTLPYFEKIKRIITVHDLTPLVFPEHFPSGVKGAIKWQIQKQNLLRSARILTDSESSKKDICKFTGLHESRIDVVYLAASEEFKKIDNVVGEKRLKKYNLPKKYLVYVGDATWNKNLPRLLKAAIKNNLPLVMIGKTLTEKNFDQTNPWNKDLLETQNLSQESQNINMLGFIPTDDLIAIYNNAIALVMPSLYEGFGLPVLEAMQSGCPVITSQRGSLPEVAGNAAFYVDAEEIQSIADGMNEIFENTKLQSELSQKGIIQARKFSWKKTSEKTIESYRNAIES